MLDETVASTVNGRESQERIVPRDGTLDLGLNPEAEIRKTTEVVVRFDGKREGGNGGIEMGRLRKGS